MSGSPIRQEDRAAEIELTGEGFREGGEVVGGGTGVTTTRTTVWDTTRVTATLRVDSTAALGLRDVTFRQLRAGGGREHTLAAAVAVYVYELP